MSPFVGFVFCLFTLSPHSHSLLLMDLFARHFASQTTAIFAVIKLAYAKASSISTKSIIYFLFYFFKEKFKLISFNYRTKKEPFLVSVTIIIIKLLCSFCLTYLVAIAIQLGVLLCGFSDCMVCGHGLIMVCLG